MNLNLDVFENPNNSNENPFNSNENPFNSNENPFNSNENPFNSNENPFISNGYDSIKFLNMILINSFLTKDKNWAPFHLLFKYEITSYDRNCE